MTAYTSTQDGDWNVAATWGGGGSPSTGGGDTVTIDHTVTIPDGHSTICSGTNNATLIIGEGTSGSLTLDGDLLNTTGSTFTMAANSTIDLATHRNNTGNTSASTCTVNINGTSGNRVTINGTTGSLWKGWTNHRGSSTCAYADFNGVEEVTLGTTVLQASETLSVTYTTFTGANIVYVGNGIQAGVVCTAHHLDWRDPVGGTKQFWIGNYDGTPTATPNVHHLTMSGGGQFRTELNDVVNEVVMDVVTMNPLGVGTGLQFTNILLYNYGLNAQLDNKNMIGYDGWYYYDDVTTNHHGFIAEVTNGTTITLENGVYEHQFVGGSAFDALITSDDDDSGTLDVLNNIWIAGKSSGVVCSHVGGTSLHTMNFHHNTMVGVANATWSAAAAFMARTESSGDFGGNVSLKSNLVAFMDGVVTNSTAVDTTDGANADQFSSIDYNGYYQTADRHLNVSFTLLSEGDTDFGGNDIQDENPSFVDWTRDLASWDASLGGAGTAANAITEMLKMNGHGGTFDTNYTVAALLTWVRAGFVVQNPVYDGAGHDSVTTGAMEYQSSVGNAGRLQHMGLYG